MEIGHASHDHGHQFMRLNKHDEAHKGKETGDRQNLSAKALHDFEESREIEDHDHDGDEGRGVLLAGGRVMWGLNHDGSSLPAWPR